ncbi:hypothetical protein E2320_006807 [Naja naja]|nr:hypothetical protein E2320_006807 [Naja naja]
MRPTALGLLLRPAKLLRAPKGEAQPAGPRAQPASGPERHRRRCRLPTSTHSSRVRRSARPGRVSHAAVASPPCCSAGEAGTPGAQRPPTFPPWRGERQARAQMELPPPRADSQGAWGPPPWKLSGPRRRGLAGDRPSGPSSPASGPSLSRVPPLAAAGKAGGPFADHCRGHSLPLPPCTIHAKLKWERAITPPPNNVGVAALEQNDVQLRQQVVP